jgi:hypothetical protein
MAFQHDPSVRMLAGQHLVKCALGSFIPMPRIIKGFDLGLRLFTRWALNQNVIGSVRIEGRIKVNQIDAIVCNTLA